MAADVMVKAYPEPVWTEEMDNGSAKINACGGSGKFGRLDLDGYNQDNTLSGRPASTQHMAIPMDDTGWYNKLQGRFDNKDYYKPT